MRFIVLIILSLSISFCCLAQKIKQPKNIDAAIRLLEETVGDSILSASKKMSLNEFKEVFEHEQPLYYQTVNSWIYFDNKKNKFVQYYEKEGVDDPMHIRKIVLNAFYRHLHNNDIDHKSLVAHYREMEEEWKYEDKDKLNADSLRGNYIPETIQDCFTQIDATCPKEVREDIATWNEEDFVNNAHWGLGLWMINTWRLWEGSRLSDYFNNEGIYQPEFMSDIILKSYHRYLNHADIQTPQLIQFYKTVGQIIAKKAIEEKEKDYLHYKTNDTVFFRYRINESLLLKEKHIARCFAKGIIMDKDPLSYSIKVRVLDVCGDNSILFFDNDTKDVDEHSNGITEIKHLEAGHDFWFYYEDWQRK
jgi:hypothetical protein